MPILEEILAATRATLPGLRQRAARLEREAADRPAPASLESALRGRRVALIAEVKRRSPSAGEISPGLDPVSLAGAYQRGGAAAISVLTDTAHFGGSIDDLVMVAGAVQVPILRKDFIVDELQLVEARAAGASAVLLIVRALEQRRLEQLLRAATEAGLDALVEAHDREELDRAIGAGARIVGINARNLDDFSIDRDGALRLLSTIPAELVAVAESGMTTVEDVEAAAQSGADAVLIGGALSSAAEPELRAASFAGVSRRGR